MEITKRYSERERPPETWRSIRVLNTVNSLFCRTYHRLIVREPQRLPRVGSGIVVCNHISGLDPLMIQAACQRLIIWMMAKEYYDLKPLNWIFRKIMAIPVERSGRDMPAMRAAMRALADGRMLGIFPEGWIEKTHELMPFQQGVALMAIKCNVPVYPAYIAGTMRDKEMVTAYRERNMVNLRFGPPVEFDRSATSRQALEAVTAKIQAAVQTLKDRQDKRGLIDLP